MQGLDHVATGKGQAGQLAIAVHGHFQPGGQGIGHAHAHTVQAAGEAVGAAIALVELAAGVQPGEDQLDHRGAFFRVQAAGDASAIVFHAHRAIGVQHHTDLLAKTGQGFVGGVVDHLLHDVQGVVGAGVHAGALLDGLQALEHTNGLLGVGSGGGTRGGGGSRN